MILFLFTIMLMNLNKEDEVHKPRITVWALGLLLFDVFGLIAIFINSNINQAGL
jgi:NADH-quinone oxidoreductase subunit J